MSRETVNVNPLVEPQAWLNDLDQADMARLVSGHDPALNDLMARHAEKLFHYLTRCLQNAEDAADLAQETFVRVYQHRSNFDSGQKFSTWLYAIATNLVKDRYRYRSRHPQASLDAEKDGTGADFKDSLSESSPTPDQSLVTSERADAVRQAITALPEELRAPLILSEYEDLSHSEVGAILKCSAKAVETRLYRARQQLRQSLTRWLGTS